LNLAAFKYRDVLKEFGGPIDRIVTAPTSIFGVKSYTANAFLIPSLVAQSSAMELFGNANGAGESSSPQIARYKAISEALERWAYQKTQPSSDAGRYGFDVEPSSTGLAAYPGLFRRDARPSAYLEAVERLSLMSWWEGHCDGVELPPLRDGIRGLRLRHPAPTGEVVVVYRRSPDKGFYCYAYGSAKTLAQAQTRAISELARTDYVLSRRFEKGVSEEPKHFFERRCVYFSTEAGHERFQERLRSKATKSPIAWAPVFDGEIVGPWSKYATVWRVAHRMPSMAYLDRTITDHLFW
jgi:hypothetical protein